MPDNRYKHPNHYPLRINPTLMDKLKHIAYESGRSINKEIEQLVIQHIKQYEEDFGIIDLSQAKTHY